MSHNARLFIFVIDGWLIGFQAAPIESARSLEFQMLEIKLGKAEESMRVLEFIASIVGSTAWPIAAFVIAFLFRTQIRALVGRINEIGFGDAKATFARELDAAEKKAESLPPPPESTLELEQDPALEPDAVGENEEATGEDLPGDDTESIAPAYHKVLKGRYSQPGVESGRFAALLEISPGAAILDTYRVVERTLFRVAERKNLDFPISGMTVRALAYRLAEAGLIPIDVAQLVAQLQDMRNRAAHGAEPSVTDAMRFRDIATRVVATLREPTRQSDSADKREQSDSDVIEGP